MKPYLTALAVFFASYFCCYLFILGMGLPFEWDGLARTVSLIITITYLLNHSDRKPQH